MFNRIRNFLDFAIITNALGKDKELLIFIDDTIIIKLSIKIKITNIKKTFDKD